MAHLPNDNSNEVVGVRLMAKENYTLKTSAQRFWIWNTEAAIAPGISKYLRYAYAVSLVGKSACLSGQDGRVTRLTISK
jgi:hypothetical protein